MPGLLDGISTSRLKSKRRWILGVVVIAWSLSGAQTTNQLAGPMTISVDATQVMHKILHAELSYSVQSGPLTLYYPKWLPADHSPDGPIWNVAGLKFFAAVNGTVAYSKIYTHLGCPAALYEQTTHHILCPCHQSTFDAARGAAVLFGPAARPLPQLPITTDSEGYLVAQSDFHEPVGPSFWERG